jgi:hypothetical protein
MPTFRNTLFHLHKQVGVYTYPPIIIIIIIITFNLKHCSLQGLLCDLGYTFQLSPPGVSPRESTQRRKAELCAKNVRKFCLNVDPTLHLGIFYMP